MAEVCLRAQWQDGKEGGALEWCEVDKAGSSKERRAGGVCGKARGG